ncbi:DUF2267 domain-containing protein [Saccharomonospora sp.]|uniref:DUF2267 domain-containing protein n=1 Tax=Saccharomonospora sp. TaxID=33913 RepID=UPI002612F09D|nr:DUF2267 domain-containing protein [Saccharomonospora sp.]
MTNTGDPLARAQNTAHEWLTTVGEALGTQDRRYTYRVLRAWLHTIRDRLTVESAAHFAAQLPEMWRGTFYDGWVPSKVPLRHSAEYYIDRIADTATIRRTDVRSAMRRVSDGMRRLLSPGSLERALDHLPRDLQEIFTPTTQEATTQSGTDGDATELWELRRKVEFLVDAVSDLNRQLMDRPSSGPRTDRDPEAITAAEDMLLPRQGIS